MIVVQPDPRYLHFSDKLRARRDRIAGHGGQAEQDGRPGHLHHRHEEKVPKSRLNLH